MLKVTELYQANADGNMYSGWKTRVTMLNPEHVKKLYEDDTMRQILERNSKDEAKAPVCVVEFKDGTRSYVVESLENLNGLINKVNTRKLLFGNK